MADYNPLSVEDALRPVAAELSRPSVAPSTDPAELTDIATFTWACPFGCTVDVVDGQEQPHYGVDDEAPGPDEVPPLSVPRSRTHAAITLLGLSTRWFRRVEITGKKVTIEQLRVDPRGRLAVAGDDLAVATYTIDVTPDQS